MNLMPIKLDAQSGVGVLVAVGCPGTTGVAVEVVAGDDNTHGAALFNGLKSVIVIAYWFADT